MKRSNHILIAVVALLAAAYGYFFTDWFRERTIQIIPQNRPMMGAMRPGAANCPVSFSLDQPYELTSIRVAPVDPAQTNRVGNPVWELTTASNSVPTRGFLYGESIPGMRQEKGKSQAQDLYPQMLYQIQVEAGRAKGQVRFYAMSPAALR